jgi:hypothetical protein
MPSVWLWYKERLLGVSRQKFLNNLNFFCNFRLFPPVSLFSFFSSLLFSQMFVSVVDWLFLTAALSALLVSRE